jgi:hypothetical protein
LGHDRFLQKLVQIHHSPVIVPFDPIMSGMLNRRKTIRSKTRRVLVSLWFYKENNNLRAWKKCIYSTYSPLRAPHTYDFVVLTSLPHPRKILLVVLQIGKARDLSAPLRTHHPVSVTKCEERNDTAQLDPVERAGLHHYNVHSLGRYLDDKFNYSRSDGTTLLVQIKPLILHGTEFLYNHCSLLFLSGNATIDFSLRLSP